MELKGKKIIGKWNKNAYMIEEKIGAGGVGNIYMGYDIKNKRYCALKISRDLHSITKESHMLSKFKDIKAIPEIIEVDDYEIMGKVYYFIVLEYIYGENLKDYIKKNRIDIRQLLGLIIIVSEIISKLHSLGYIFGDLKPENIMIDRENKKIKIIDLGGVTQIGTSLKEFTPLYDRAKWNMGLRKADVGYDLFSICMILSSFILGPKEKILKMDIYDIIDGLKTKKINKKLINLLANCLLQKETNFNIFIKALKKIYKNEKLQPIKSDRKKEDLIINTYLISSLIFFITILWVVIIK